MSTEVSWVTVAKPLSHWIIGRLPRFIFERFYGERDLENHIKVRLTSARLESAGLLKGLQVPSLEIELELFNLSPYLDVRVISVRSLLWARNEEGRERTFAQIDEWEPFDLTRGEPYPLRQRLWPNEHQAAVLSICSAERSSLEIVVALRMESKIGTSYRLKRLRLPGLCNH